MRARSAMSWMRAPWKPRSANTASAASRMALRKSARASSRRRGADRAPDSYDESLFILRPPAMVTGRPAARASSRTSRPRRARGRRAVPSARLTSPGESAVGTTSRGVSAPSAADLAQLEHAGDAGLGRLRVGRARPRRRPPRARPRRRGRVEPVRVHRPDGGLVDARGIVEPHDGEPEVGHVLARWAGGPARHPTAGSDEGRRGCRSPGTADEDDRVLAEPYAPPRRRPDARASR